MATNARWAGRKNGGAFVPRSELSAEQQTLLAAVPHWKREWVRPASLKSNQSPDYKVKKWVLDTSAGAEEGTEEEMEAAVQVIANQPPTEPQSTTNSLPTSALPTAPSTPAPPTAAPSGATTPLPQQTHPNPPPPPPPEEHAGLAVATNDSVKPPEGDAPAPTEAEAMEVDKNEVGATVPEGEEVPGKEVVLGGTVEEDDAAAVMLAEDETGVTLS